MNRIAIWIANGALLVLACFLSAHIITAIAAEALAPTPSEAPPDAEPPQRAVRSWEVRQAIVQRNLFNVSTLSPPAPELAEPDPEDVYEKTRLPLQLLGTAAGGDPMLALAAVQDLETREHLVVRPGDKLKEKAEVVRIEPRRIVLRNAGQLEELSLEEEQPGLNPAGRVASARVPRGRSAAATPPGTPRENARDRVRRLMENRFQLDRADVESVARNPAELFSQARILPKYEDGQMKGVQLNAIKPGSIFEEIGIQNGDVITEFNGIQVTSQQESAQVLRELTEASQFQVTVVGEDGSQRQLFYEVQ